MKKTIYMVLAVTFIAGAARAAVDAVPWLTTEPSYAAGMLLAAVLAAIGGRYFWLKRGA